MISARHATRVFAVVPLALLIDPVRLSVEGSMFMHMLLEFPLLLAAGASAALLADQRWPRLAAHWARFDALGLLGLVALSAVSAIWMVPAALDAAQMQPLAASAKYLSWWLAGWSIALAWPRLPDALRVLLLGNLGWMLITAGMLYASSEQRLCVSYRFDEQVWTGRALCAVGGLAALAVIAVGMGVTPRRSGEAA